MKRKAAEAGLPSSLAQEPAGTSGTGPFVVYFPSGYEPNAGDDAACEWAAYAHKDRRNQFQLVAKTHKSVDFVGSTASPAYSGALPCRYALGLFSRRAGRLQVMPAEGGKIMRMEARVRGHSYTPRDTVTEIEPGKLREANMRLVEEFGSQRRKRQLKAKEAGKVEAGHVSAAGAVLGMIADAGATAAQTKEEVIQAALAHRNIPPHHPEAESAEEAYRADELVPLSIRDALEVTKLFPAENKPEYREQLRSSGMFGAGYVFTRLPVLRSAGTKEQREERCRMLAMLGHLLKLQGRWGVMKARPEGGLEELAQKAKIAPGVLEGLLDLFYSEEAGQQEGERKYLLSNDKKTLMLGYILILAVRAEQGCVLEPEHVQALADELKLRVGDVVARYRELGCHDIAVSASAGNPNTGEGARSRGYRITLMPQSAEPKTLADYFPRLKLGAKKK